MTNPNPTLLFRSDTVSLYSTFILTLPCSSGGKMSGSLLPEHQAETAPTAVAAAPAGGRNDASTDGPDERPDEPRGHGRLQPALWEGGAWRDASPPDDGPRRRGHAKPCQCCRWQAWIQRPSQPECAGSRQKGIHTIITLSSGGFKFPKNPTTFHQPLLD